METHQGPQSPDSILVSIHSCDSLLPAREAQRLSALPPASSTSFPIIRGFLETLWECEFLTGSLLELRVTVETASFMTNRHFRRSPTSGYRGFSAPPPGLALAHRCPLLSLTFLAFLEGLGREVSRVVKVGAHAG